MAEPDVAPTGPSAFDQPWTNPLDAMMGNAPSIDYGKALAAKKDITQKELGAVSSVIDKSEREEKTYESIAQKKFMQLESVDPMQIKPWKAEEEQKKYSDDPYSAFGSFAMVAGLGLAAFTKTPFINSMNAMAGVINGRKEGMDQQYDRAYKAWQDNTKLFLDRFNMVKTQVGEAVDMMKTKGEMGKTQLANTLTKYGLAQDLALLNAGYDDMLSQKWVAQAKAVEGLAKSRDEIENLHMVRQAEAQENQDRQANGQPPMTAQEAISFKQGLVAPKTPEQAAFADAWKSFLKEHPNATAAEKADFARQARAYGRTAASNDINSTMGYLKDAGVTLSPLEESTIRGGLSAKGAQGPASIARMNDAIQKIVSAQESGTPLTPDQRSALLSSAAGVGAPGGAGIDMLAETWLKSGTFPGRNAQLNKQITDRAAELAKERGVAAADIPKMQQEFKAQQVAIQRFMSGPQGQQTSALNMVEHHIGTLRELSKALDNGDFTLANWLANKAARELGHPEPNNMALGAQIVGTEALRAMAVAGAGTGEERDKIAAAFSEYASPDQINGAADTMEQLMAGKLFALRLQFPNATGLPLDKFDVQLSERTKSVLLPLIGADTPVQKSADTPPVNLLQEGHVTTFKNGQSWTLKDGKPTKVSQ
jgi:hypothetical protein